MPKGDKTGFKFKGPASIVDFAISELSYFVEDDDGEIAIPSFWRRSLARQHSKLIVIVGENAAGKSFMRRIVHVLVREVKFEFIPISMEARCGGMGVMSAFVYGSEQWQATGENSANTVLTGIKTCRSRTEPVVIFWDEPDLGLSDNASAGAGKVISAFVNRSGDNVKAVFVATHSRYLVKYLLPSHPHYLHLGTGDGAPETIEAWLNQPVVPISLEAMSDHSHQRFKAIQKILGDER